VKRVVELSILGHKLAVTSDESEEYIKAVEECLARTIEEVRGTTKAVATLDLALLVALNLAGEFVKVKTELERLEKRSGELVDQLEKKVS